MVSMSALLGVAAIAFGMVLTPGPNMMYLVSRSLTQGRAAGLVSLTGVVTGFVAYVLATAAGLSLLFVAVPELFWTVKIAGACYLLWLAWGMVRGSRSAFSPDLSLPGHSPRRLYLMGITTCLLNPKIALMYGALLPQFVDRGAGSTTVQLLELGLVQVVVATIVNAMWVLLAAQVARLLRRSRGADRAVRWGQRRASDVLRRAPRALPRDCLTGHSRVRRTTPAGLPAATTWSGRSFSTTLPAPTTVFRPMRTPGPTVTPAPSHAFSPISIGSARSQPRRRISWSSTGCRAVMS